MLLLWVDDVDGGVVGFVGGCVGVVCCRFVVVVVVGGDVGVGGEVGFV